MQARQLAAVAPLAEQETTTCQLVDNKAPTGRVRGQAGKYLAIVTWLVDNRRVVFRLIPEALRRTTGQGFVHWAGGHLGTRQNAAQFSDGPG